MKDDNLQMMLAKDAESITLDPTTVLELVKKRRNDFARIILLRDYREGVVAFLLAAFFAFRGWITSFPALYFMAAMCALVGIIIVLDRLKQRKLRPDITATLQDVVSASLEEVRHQVKVLRSVFWWYLLPLLLGFIAIYGSVALETKSVATAAGGFLFSVALLVVVYFINRWTVTTSLLPRQSELQQLLDSLSDSEG